MALTLEQFMKIATQEQSQLLQELAGVARQEEQLAERISRIFQNAKPEEVYSPDRGHSWTLLEDEDDAAVITMGSREELRRIRERMKGYFIRAAEIGMKDVGFIQRNYEQYVGQPLPSDA